MPLFIIRMLAYFFFYISLLKIRELENSTGFDWSSNKPTSPAARIIFFLASQRSLDTALPGASTRFDRAAEADASPFINHCFDHTVRLTAHATVGKR